MPEYLAPGVFVEEIDSGSKPIEGVGVNTAAFVGYAKSGEFNKPIFIDSWTQFCRTFGEDENAVIRALQKELGRSAKELLRDRRGAKTLSIYDFAKEALNNAGRNIKDSWADFIKAVEAEIRDDESIGAYGSPYLPNSYLAHSVQGYFLNGGSKAYVLRVATEGDIKTLSSEARPSPALTATLELGGLSIKALESGSGGNGVSVDVSHVGDGDGFTVKFTKGTDTESFGTEEKPLTLSSAKRAISEGGTKSKIVDVQVKTGVTERPTVGQFTLNGGADEVKANALALPQQHELSKVSADDFIGDEAKRTGFSALAELEDANMVLVPDLMAKVFTRRKNAVGEFIEEVTADAKTIENIRAAQAMLVAFCEGMGDRMAILDPIPGLTPQEMKDQTLDAPWTCKKGQAAIYYPWIKIVDPTRRGPNGERYQMFAPPSGHIAGVWCRVVDNLGVHKAPANEGLFGVTSLEWDVSHREQEILNPNGINCIRQFPGEGIKVWGARTLATVNNPSWKYINVRRLFNFLEKSMERGLRWAVFEPNDADLWARVRRNLSSFLWVQWKEGKLFGATPEEAFYVKCDRETNPTAMIDQGRMYVEVGVNPVKPAEFVIVRIGQWSGGSETTEN